MTKILESVHALVWGAPALVGILGVGLYLTVALGLPQLRLFPEALRQFFRSLRGSSSYTCLCTALAATVGTGNLVGVAGAICLGGPGSIFWMWVCGFVGMATKFCEATLAVRFRGSRKQGGPMYILSKGLGKPALASCYALLGLLAAFGVGNATQINALTEAVRGTLAEFAAAPPRGWDILLGLGLSVLVWFLLKDGGSAVGRAAQTLVPLASLGYILLCTAALLLRLDRLGEAVLTVFRSAFSPRAATGGMIGSAFCALRIGCARGVFTNEAGMGTASIAHAAADVEHPVRQGLMGIVEVFLDTLLICTLTALVILTSGVPIPYGTDLGGALTGQAFSRVLGSWTGVFLTGALCCFALATVLGWSLYGGRCAEYLWGRRGWDIFRIAQSLLVLPAVLSRPGPVWTLAEIFNGLMALPNLIALAVLAPELRRLTIEFQEKSGA